MVALCAALASPCFGEMYKWTDEKGTVHFTDNPSQIPEKHKPGAESRKTPTEISTPQKEIKPAPPAVAATSPGGAGIDAPLVRRGEVLTTEVVVNGRKAQYFIVDTGASFVSINRQMAEDLGIIIDKDTPLMPIATASDVILSPMVTLRSVRVGKAEVEGVDAIVHNLPTDTAGLLGNSFLNKYRVVFDPANGKMTLFPVQAQASLDRPGGYGRDYWSGRFHFYNRLLVELKQIRTSYERRERRAEANGIDNAIRYFEDQLAELDRKASFAGVPRNWRE